MVATAHMLASAHGSRPAFAPHVLTVRSFGTGESDPCRSTMDVVTIAERPPRPDRTPGPGNATPAWSPLVPLWEACDQGWFVYGPDGRLAYESRALLHLLHRRPDPGRTGFVADVVPSARRAFERRWAEVRSGRCAHTATLLPVEIDGVTHALQVTMVAVDAPGGRAVIGMIRRPTSSSVEPTAAPGRVEQVLARVLCELLAVAPDDAHDDLAGSRASAVTLSARQGQVMDLLLAGECTSAIAARLSLSPHTVRNHTKAVFRAFGVHSQAELIHHHRR